MAHLANIREMIARRAAAAGLTDPEEFAASFHILMKGSIISAAEGDVAAASRAQVMARALIERHRPPRLRVRREAVRSWPPGQIAVGGR